MRSTIILLSVLLTACSGGAGVMDGIMQSWVGAHVDEVIGQWGYMDEEKTIAGKKLYVWHYTKQGFIAGTSHTRGSVDPDTGSYSSTTTTSPGGVFYGSCTRILEVDKKNIVASWQWHGNNCPFAEWMEYADWRRKNAETLPESINNKKSGG